MAPYQYIAVEKAEGRCRVTLNRPQKRNALCNALLEELRDVLVDADKDGSVHCCVLYGAGADFCAGFDLQDPSRKAYGGSPTFEDDVDRLERQQQLMMVIFDMRKPVICAVQGNCLAGGTCLAFLCDFVIVADNARIGFPPARDFGVLPTQMMLYHAGPQWTKRIVITGDSLTGADAARVGLAMKCVPLGALRDEAEGLADRLALIPTGLLSSNKRSVNLAMELMGARTMQRINCELDARGHLSGSWYGNIGDKVKAAGSLSAALRERNKKFGSGVASVDSPEGRLRARL
eukprot:TRINITY_DN10398_c0_g1_i1.p1 TRINITY_DN10398_c0_g1~~TRINITY_DN10398_c0_g1_i1.p1  ORF type:complete len:290 (+),score=97.60 TRINITY_DN10398_c0_g1_i1:86-955(+)